MAAAILAAPRFLDDKPRNAHSDATASTLAAFRTQVGSLSRPVVESAGGRRLVHTESPRQPKPAARLWTVRKNGRHVECALRFHGESYGWECQGLYDGGRAYGRRVARYDLALDEAEANRIAPNDVVRLRI